VVSKNLRKPQKFSPSNDLTYTVVNFHAYYNIFKVVGITQIAQMTNLRNAAFIAEFLIGRKFDAV